MMFREIFRFEVVCRVRSASTWFYLGLFVALALVMVDGILIQEAKASGNVTGTAHANAPGLIAMAALGISMIGMVVTAALFGDAATRDVQARIHPLFYTVLRGRAAYLGGRFAGAFVVNAALLATVPLSLLLGLKVMDVAPELLGPFRAGSYLRAYFVLLLPNLFATAAILFAAAALTGRVLAAYVAGLLLFLGSMLTMEATGAHSTAREVAALLDPFGFTALNRLALYWTPVERNVLPIRFEGLMLWNRLLWVAAAVGVLAFVSHRFRFAYEGEGGRRRRAQEAHLTGEPRAGAAAVSVPRVRQAFGLGVQVRQALAVVRRSFGEIVTNRYLFVFLAVSLFFVFIAGWDAWVVLETPTWPVTYVVARGVLGHFPPVIYLLVALCAGELVWREREAGLSEIIDAAPVPNWVSLVGKFGALVLALVGLQAVLMAGGVLLQALQGYYRFEPGLYVQILFGFQLLDYVLWAALAMLVHVLVNQKYLGHVVFVLYFVFYAYGRARLGIEHDLLVYPSGPGWTYSDLSGFGPFLAPYLWFKLYWGAWALLFAVGANLFWVRGLAQGGWHRIRSVRMRLTRPALRSAVLAAGFVLLTGGFVFYNTNVLNEYRTRRERAGLLAAYERQYKRYEAAPQPRLTGSSLRVELYPERRAVVLAGTYLLRNRTDAPIDSVHLMVRRDAEARVLAFDRAAEPVLEDATHGYRIFALERPLQPGDSLRLRFDLAFAARGFFSDGVDPAVVKNGTFFDHDWLPILGYRPEFELKGDEARREQGLAPRALPPSPHDEAARRRSPRNAEWFHSEVVIGTDRDEIAVAPGALVRTWEEGARRYFHYRTDAPIKNVYAFLSAAYAVHEDRWRDVEIQILHHPAHTYNLDRMLRSVKASLDYITEHFGPYPYGQIRIAEVPRHAGTFARAFPGLIAYSEGFGFLARAEDGIDYPFAVTAHEVAHQWWGGQYAPAEVEGRSVLYETLAHYSALMVLEKTHGREQVQRFLDLMMHRYLIGRQNGGNREVPLLRSSEMKFIHYDKGAVAMYALRDYLGEERVNTALRRFLEAHRFGGAPYPTTLDLYGELQAVTPDSLQHLLADLFEEITLWDLRTEAVRAEPDGAGGYRVTLAVEAGKMRADSAGRVVPVPMDDLVYVGVFAASEEGGGKGEPLYLRPHRLRSGAQTITVTVPRPPARAGVDPYHRLIDRKREDNIRAVTRGEASDVGGAHAATSYGRRVESTMLSRPDRLFMRHTLSVPLPATYTVPDSSMAMP